MLALEDVEKTDNKNDDSSVAEQVEHCKRLAGVLTITKDMLLAAQLEQWEEVARLEGLRKGDLELCFAQPVLVNDSPVVAEAVAALIHLNEELMALVKQARDQVSSESQALTRRQSAARSYQENQ